MEEDKRAPLPGFRKLFSAVWKADCSVCGLPHKFEKLDPEQFYDPKASNDHPEWVLKRRLPDGHESCRAAKLAWRNKYEAMAGPELLKHEKARKETGIPSFFFDRMTFSSFVANEKNLRAYTSLYNWKVTDKHGAILVGPPGVGKTHLVVALLARWFEAGVKVKFINTNRFFDQLRSHESGSAIEQQMLELERAIILGLDDLGAEKLTEWAEAKLERILTSRIETCRPIFITTNLDESQLADRLSSRTLSRLAGLVEVFEVGGEDKRKLT